MHIKRKYKFIGLSFVFLLSAYSFAQENEKTFFSGVLKRNNIGKQSIEVADKILNHQIYLGSSFKVYQAPKNITWKENPYKNETWCFYFQSMDIIGYLSNGYEVSSDEKYLKGAKELIDTWTEKNVSFGTKLYWKIEKYAFKLPVIRKNFCSVWDDHSAANRVTNLIQFYTVYKNQTQPDLKYLDKLEQILQLHGDFLGDNSNYNSTNNHGIFQDRSLLQLTYLFPQLKNSTQWYETAVKRLFARLNTEITPSGIHKEHSPTYHNIVLILLSDIAQFIKKDNANLKRLNEIMFKMEDYFAYVIKPNGTIPNIGDSSPSRPRKYPTSPTTHPHLIYAFNQGTQGAKPDDTSVYKDGGVAIFRDGWLTKNPFFMMFTAAYHSQVHKHADDLSFILDLGPTEFIVDSGKYNYDEEDPYRKYFRSTMAHNTVVVDGNSYAINPKQIGKSRIDSYGKIDDASYVSGSHDLYEGVKIKRTLVYSKKGFVLIHDTAASSSKHTFAQHFQIGPNVSVQKNDTHVTLSSNLDKHKINLKEVNAGQWVILDGQTDPIQGWLSKQLNKKIPITTIQYSVQGNQADFKTVLSLDPKILIRDFNEIDVSNAKNFEIEFENGKKSILSFATN